MPVLAAGGALLGALYGVPAYAQQAEVPERAQQAEVPERAQEAPRPKSEARQGLRIVPSLTAVYDDNVYRVDSRREDPVADVIITPGIEIGYDRDIGIAAVNLRAFAGYDRFISESQRSKPLLEIEGSGKYVLAGQCWVRPSASYRQQRADYGDINSASENLQKFSTLGVAADCERPAGLYPVVAWQRDTTRNGDGFEYADQTSNLYRAGIGYARPSLGKLTAYYEHVTSERPQLAVENRSDAYGLSFSRSVSPLTSIDADVRWMHVTSTAAVSSYNGPGWDVRISTMAIPRVKLTGATERTIVNDSLIATGFAVRTAWRLSADVALSELTTIGVYGELARRDFRQDAAIRPFSYTHDRTNQFGLIARRKITEALALDLTLSHLDRSTNSDVSNYRANRVSLGATMRF
jgi:predicted porin